MFPAGVLFIVWYITSTCYNFVIKHPICEMRAVLLPMLFDRKFEPRITKTINNKYTLENNLVIVHRI